MTTGRPVVAEPDVGVGRRRCSREARQHRHRRRAHGTGRPSGSAWCGIASSSRAPDNRSISRRPSRRRCSSSSGASPARGAITTRTRWRPTAQRLQRKGLRMVEFPQSVPNLTAASQNLYELIKRTGHRRSTPTTKSAWPFSAPSRSKPRAVGASPRKALAQDRHRRGAGQAAYAAVQKGESGFMRMGTYNPYTATANPLERRAEAAHARGPLLREGSAKRKPEGMVRCQRLATSSR